MDWSQIRTHPTQFTPIQSNSRGSNHIGLRPSNGIQFNAIRWIRINSTTKLAIRAAIYRSAQGPGPESAPRSAFSVFLGAWLRVPQRVLFECFLPFFIPKNAKKHSQSTLWGTRNEVPKNTEKALRPEPLSTPVHGGPDRNTKRSSLN